MNMLIEYGCDFNVPIDKDGNTPIMYFIMVGDYFATTLLLEKYQNLDLSIKNKHGFSASYLLFNIDASEKDLKNNLIFHKTFDYDFTDNNNNNFIMYFLVRNKLNDDFNKILKRKRIKNQVNNKKEKFHNYCN